MKRFLLFCYETWREDELVFIMGFIGILAAIAALGGIITGLVFMYLAWPFVMSIVLPSVFGVVAIPVGLVLGGKHVKAKQEVIQDDTDDDVRRATRTYI